MSAEQAVDCFSSGRFTSYTNLRLKPVMFAVNWRAFRAVVSEWETKAAQSLSEAVQAATALEQSQAECATLRQQLRELHQKWYESADWEVENGDRQYASGLDQCADELKGLLGNTAGADSLEPAPRRED